MTLERDERVIERNFDEKKVFLGWFFQIYTVQKTQLMSPEQTTQQVSIK